MELHCRRAGNGPPLVLLHGLFGSNENLGSIARALSDRFTMYAMDLRNHGRSPQGHRMDYPTLAQDVRETMDAYLLDHAAVLGHSLGGKTAMELALSAPDRVARMIVVDIAPVAYDRRHDQELEALCSLDLSGLGSRKDADHMLAPSIPNPTIRQFLLKNLIRSDKGFTWRIPLETIRNQYDRIADPPPHSGRYAGPALFLRAERSDYIQPQHEDAIHERFPNAQIETIADAGHWLPVEAPNVLVKLVAQFLDSDH